MKGRKPLPKSNVASLAAARDKANHQSAEQAAEQAKKEKASIPFCPDVVRNNVDALEVWERLSPKLAKLGLLSPAYEGTWANYCIAYARWVEAERQMRDPGENSGVAAGLVIKSPNNYPIQNPWLAIANRAMEQMRQFSGEMGLSAVSFTRASRGAQGDLFPDDLEQFLNGG